MSKLEVIATIVCSHCGTPNDKVILYQEWIRTPNTLNTSTCDHCEKFLVRFTVQPEQDFDTLEHSEHCSN